LANRPIVLVVGARPNFVKAGPIIDSFEYRGMDYVLLHTGQHYDYELSKSFFDDFSMKEPDINLGVGSGNHGEQTGKIMIELEKALFRIDPSIVVVFGDVNSTVAASLVASKLHIPIAHIEAGLRSFDRRMPEEINRVLTDSISDFLFTPSIDANKNLEVEGISSDKIFFVGNIMIDSLKKYLKKAKSRKVFSEFGLDEKKYWVLTLHRPSNVDTKEKFFEILSAMDFIRRHITVVFSMHPRTKKMIGEFELYKDFPWISGGDNFISINPIGYIDFLSLEYYSQAVLTDSGGMQEETTFLNIPCVTIRENTERPITVDIGTNVLCSSGKDIIKSAEDILQNDNKKGKIPMLWDGNTAERIVEVLSQHIK
jgi:UDP-N-acetylglucosamine 2-epimerase (non-hydrolysing)